MEQISDAPPPRISPGLRNVMFIVNIQALIIFFLTIALAVYVNNAENRDRFFAETNEGRKMQMVGLKYPNMGKIAISNWTVQAITQIMTFSFHDYDKRFELSRKNFTPSGWDGFYKAMQLSKFALSIIEAEQIITAIPKGEPVLSREGLIRGKYSWVFDMGILLTFRAGSVKHPETRTVRVVIQQVPTRDNPNGIGIAEWYMY